MKKTMNELKKLTNEMTKHFPNGVNHISHNTFESGGSIKYYSNEGCNYFSIKNEKWEIDYGTHKTRYWLTIKQMRIEAGSIPLVPTDKIISEFVTSALATFNTYYNEESLKMSKTKALKDLLKKRKEIEEKIIIIRKS